MLLSEAGVEVLQHDDSVSAEGYIQKNYGRMAVLGFGTYGFVTKV